jgi:Peptidase M15
MHRLIGICDWTYANPFCAGNYVSPLMLFVRAFLRRVMRALFVVLFLLFTLLSGHPAVAGHTVRPAGAPGFSFLNFLHPHQPTSRPAVGRRSTYSASPSCLPSQLNAALADVQARFGPVVVISTHRPGARIRRGRPSLHASCQAVDFKPAPGSYSRVAAHLRRSWTGGLGTYSSGHIHIDTGENYRWHTGSLRSKGR